MLTISSLSKRFGDDLVLDRVSVTVQAGERVGLVGPNGCGKSTLLKIIAGIEQADGGSVAFLPSDLTLGYLPQGWEVPDNLRVAEALLDAQGPLTAVQARLAELEAQMAQAGLSAESLDQLLSEYGQLQERFEALGGYDVEHQIAQVREGLGLDELPDDQLVQQLSGGQKTRLALARLLLLRPALLLLDEPTSGMSPAETDHMIELVRGLPASLALLMIEHDMKVVFSLADRVTVLYYGEVLATGTPAEIQASERVREVYLGGTH